MFRRHFHHLVPFKFRIKTTSGESEISFIQNRFPTLSTAENYRYYKQRGLDRLIPKVFPIHVPTYRRIHPLLRAYIFFLYDLDPARFSRRKISERYAIQERSLRRILNEYSSRYFLKSSGLSSNKLRHITKEDKILHEKEKQFAKAVGYEMTGASQDIEDEREIGEEFEGFSSTSDFIRLQSIEVEHMSAFPSPVKKRNPVPKRVHVDLCVKRTRDCKVINWIDPDEKVVF